MKLTGPLITFAVGLLFAFAGWNRGASISHNIGRGIADSVFGSGLLLVGGGLALFGITWLLLRLLNRSDTE